MVTTYPIMSAASKALCSAAFEVRHGRFDTASFFTVLSGARFQIASERKYLKSAEALSVILDRGEALYFSALCAFEDKKRLSAPCGNEAYDTAASLAVRTLLLFERLRTQNGRKCFREKADNIYSDIERFSTASRIYRFRALSRHGSISRALPEIEFICKCTDTAARCLRLICAYTRLL